MKEIRVSPQAEAELDGIWFYVAREASVETANRVIDGITSRFGLLARYPAAGRSREELGPDVRSFPADSYLIVYEYRTGEEVVMILHIASRGRDVPGLFLQ